MILQLIHFVGWDFKLIHFRLATYFVLVLKLVCLDFGHLILVLENSLSRF